MPQCQPFKQGAPRIVDHLCDECTAAWTLVRDLLDAAGIEYVLNPYLVRGLDYYTRTVFEFYPAAATGQQDALASGGRYDGLAAAIGQPDAPGVGFAGGLDRVIEQMTTEGEEVATAEIERMAGGEDGAVFLGCEADVGCHAVTVPCRGVGVRRCTRLTNGHSKKFENHVAMTTVFMVHYNFCRVHQTLKMTPAMAAGLTDHPWTIEDVLALM